MKIVRDKPKRLGFISHMQTSYASQVVREIHADRKARIEALAARGLRDEITAMTWPNGMIEVSGHTVRGRCGTGYLEATLEAFVKRYFKTGTMRVTRRGNIQGRPTVTYAIV